MDRQARIVAREGKDMRPAYKEYVLVFDTSGGSSAIGRLLRLVAFPIRWVLTGRAEL
ncbi:MAG: hypothetical protein ACOVPA_20215 [Rubrivivax sp.]|jgi:hypothetical protein